MSTSSQQQPLTGPTLHIIVLYLVADKNSSAEPHVDIRGDKWWRGVKPGDLVQFVPDYDSLVQFVSDEKLRRTAHVEVQFTSPDKTPFSPLGVPKVTTSDPHEVMDPSSPFVAWCYLHVGDKRYGYEGTDGRPCPGGC
jgi:hypothetical protein